MPRYELALILKDLPRTVLADALKRSCRYIWQHDGIVRNMENLGSKALPYKMTAHGQPHRTGNYFIMKFDSSCDKKTDIEYSLQRDTDVVRPTIFSIDEEQIRPCMTGDECIFGEFNKFDNERMTWRTKALKQANLYQGLKKKRKSSSV